MNVHILPALMACNINLILCVLFLILYSIDKNNKEVKYLSLLCFGFTIYVFGQIILNSNTDPELGIFWHKFQHIGIILIVPAWINFVFRYIEKKNNKFVTLTNIFGLVMLGLLFTTPFIITNVSCLYAGRYLQGKEGPLYYVLLAMLMVSMIYGYVLLVINYLKNVHVHSYELIMMFGITLAMLTGAHDILTVTGRFVLGIETTLFEYGLTIMGATLMYCWIIGKGFYEKDAMKNVFLKYFAYPLIKKDGLSGSNDESIERNVTILFADIRKFTSLSEELSPRDTVDILNKFSRHMVTVVEKHGGIVDKFMGDGMMVIFGVSDEDNVHYVSAVKAAIEMRDRVHAIHTPELKKLNRSINIGIGINTGKVIIGNVGSETRMSYTVIGDTVNTAFRLQDLASEGKILITNHVYDLVKNVFEFEPFGKIQLKNKKNPTEIYNVTKLKM